MRALDGSVKFEFALRNVALGAHAVVGLRAAGVVDAGREVDVIVARAAGFSRRIGVIQVGLGRSLRIVAGFASPHVRGINHGREIASGDDVRAARGDAGQRRSDVDLVNVNLEVVRFASGRVDHSRRMAHHADLRAASRSAVFGKLVMALVASLRRNHIADLGYFAAIRNEIVGRACKLIRQAEWRQCAAAPNRQRMGRSLIEGWQGPCCQKHTGTGRCPRRST